MHTLSDYATDIVILVCLFFQGKPADKKHPYGHGRFENISSVIIAVVLFAVGFGIGWKAVLDILALYNGVAPPRPAMFVVWIALISIVVKEGLYQYTIRRARRIDSKVLEANAWHHRSDALSSIVALAGIGGAAILGEKWVILDPLAALAIVLLIFQIGWKILASSMHDLMEGSLEDKDIRAIRKVCVGMKEISIPHKIRTRSIGSVKAVDMHVCFPDRMTLARVHEITQELKERLKEILGEDAVILIYPEPLSKHE